MDQDIVETVHIGVKLLSITSIRRGSLMALCDAEVEIAGVPIEIHGLQLVRCDDDRIQVRVPHHRGSDGTWVPSITLPQAVLDELAQQLDMSADPREAQDIVIK